MTSRKNRAKQKSKVTVNRTSKPDAHTLVKLWQLHAAKIPRRFMRNEEFIRESVPPIWAFAYEVPRRGWHGNYMAESVSLNAMRQKDRALPGNGGWAD